MKKPEKLILTIERTQTFTVEVSEEMGYDAFPESVLEFADYVSDIKNGGLIERYIPDSWNEDLDAGVDKEEEVKLLSIEEG